jgi:hypothetical protein
MKRQILLFLLFFMLLLPESPAQGAKWHFSTQIEKENFFLLKGKIDDKYPITMQLWEKAFVRCGDPHTAIQWQNGGLDGWYAYDKVGKKIPLIGYFRPDHSVRLYVPEHLLDTLDRNTCEPPAFMEVFTNGDDYDLTRLQWKQRGDSQYKEVELEVLHQASQQTTAFLALHISGVELAQVDISERSGIFSIDELNVLGASHREDGFHVLLEANDWGWREGQRYIGYLRIDEDLEVRDFTFIKTYDSWFGETQDEILYDLKFPERGIRVKEH